LTALVNFVLVYSRQVGYDTRVPYTVTTIAEAETAINALDTRLLAVEASLSTLTGTTVPALQSADTSLGGRLTTAEAAVATLESLKPVGAGRLIQLKRQGRI